MTFLFLSPRLPFRVTLYVPPPRLTASFWHSVKSLVKEPNSQLYRSSNSNFKTLPLDQKIEEEAHDTNSKRRYYPVQIGDIIGKRYQILGKLGYGLGSTVWLANETRYVLSLYVVIEKSRVVFNRKITARDAPSC